MDKEIIERFNEITGMSLQPDSLETYSGDQLERLSWDDAIRFTDCYGDDDAKIVKLVAAEVNVQGQIRNLYGEPPYGPDTERRSRTAHVAIRLEERERSGLSRRSKEEPGDE